MSAVISECGLYRYRLDRDVSPTGIVFAFFGVNGSDAADHRQTCRASNHHRAQAMTTPPAAAGERAEGLEAAIRQRFGSDLPNARRDLRTAEFRAGYLAATAPPPAPSLPSPGRSDAQRNASEFAMWVITGGYRNGDEINRRLFKMLKARDEGAK